MRRSTPAVAILAALLAAPVLAGAQERVTSFDQINSRLKPGDRVYGTDGATAPAGVDGILTAAISVAAVRLAGERRGLTGSSRALGGQGTTLVGRGWIRRHPVWFGTIMGAVAGAAIVGATVDAEASFVGCYGGAAAGALVGVIVAAR